MCIVRDKMCRNVYAKFMQSQNVSLLETSFSQSTLPLTESMAHYNNFAILPISIL